MYIDIYSPKLYQEVIGLGRAFTRPVGSGSSLGRAWLELGSSPKFLVFKKLGLGSGPSFERLVKARDKTHILKILKMHLNVTI